MGKPSVFENTRSIGGKDFVGIYGLALAYSVRLWMLFRDKIGAKLAKFTWNHRANRVRHADGMRGYFPMGSFIIFF
jgi:hypothetical protein